MLGFLNLNKAAGLTSHDCVAKIRRILKMKKVGHGGTLDPAATGVLPIAVGKATRLLPLLPGQKAYHATVQLGIQTTTDDLEGDIIQTQSASKIILDDIKSLLPQFQGRVEQIPPAFSAIQRNGQRLYELARKGEVVDVPVRTVEIEQIEILNWSAGEVAELELAITCGAGTYIRAIARDLGNLLQVGGTLAKLQRTLSCGMAIADSLTLEEIAEQTQQNTLTLYPADQSLSHLNSIILPDTEAKRWCLGQRIAASNPEQAQQWSQFITDPIRIYHEDHTFLGISHITQTEFNFVLQPKIVL